MKTQRTAGTAGTAGTRRTYSAEYKAKIALEAAKGQLSLNELGAEYNIHPNQIGQWRTQMLEALPGIFSGKGEQTQKAAEDLQAQLYQQIGQLKVELDWPKKKLNLSAEQKRELIERANPQISVRRQCLLVGLHRSNLYYAPTLSEGEESAENLELMRVLDEQYTETPFYGIRRMTAWLHTQGYMINHKRVGRLLRMMGLWAIYPGPSTSKAAPGHRIYPYLLRDVPIRERNQVWSTDIVPS